MAREVQMMGMAGAEKARSMPPMMKPAMEVPRSLPRFRSCQRERRRRRKMMVQMRPMVRTRMPAIFQRSAGELKMVVVGGGVGVEEGVRGLAAAAKVEEKGARRPECKVAAARDQESALKMPRAAIQMMTMRRMMVRRNQRVAQGALVRRPLTQRSARAGYKGMV